MTSHRAPWNSPRVLLTLLLVFVAGAASGAIGLRLSMRARNAKQIQSVSGKSAAKDAFLEKFRLERLKQELDLRPDQVSQVSAVIEDYRGFYQSIQDQVDDMRATGKTRILQVLDTAQRAKFEQMVNEIR